MTSFAVRFLPLLLTLCPLVPGTEEGDGGRDDPTRVIKGGPLTGAESHVDLRYLPDARYTGNPAQRKDYEMLLNVYVPPGGDHHPAILVVHGGAYAAGKKDKPGGGIIYEPLCQAMIQHGYAAVTFNYVLRPKGIFPQVFYDTQDAIRFLRMNAKKLRLDPTRIGAIGWSAGGWLVSTIGYAHADTLLLGTQNAGMSMGQFAQGTGTGVLYSGDPFVLKPVKADSPFAQSTPAFLFPAWAQEPAWPEQSGQVQAISYDFSFFHELAGPGSAATNVWVGDGYVPTEAKTLIEKVGVSFDLSQLTGAAYKGKSLHCPPMDKLCRPLTGSGEVPLQERILQFFDREFGAEGRAPAPEIRPHLRVFASDVNVSIVVPDPRIQVRYTTDGSEPTASSPLYDRPFTLNAAGVVKAFSTMGDRRSSGVVSANFMPGPVPPRVTGPDDHRLPEAEVGKPYRVRFTADLPGPLAWRLAGEIGELKGGRPNDPPVDPMGLILDPATGELTGSPKLGGTFWVQVQVGRGSGHLGSIRNYLLTVHGKPGRIGSGTTADDTHTEVARLASWTPEQVNTLVEALRQAGCEPVVQDHVLLVPQAQLAQAKGIVATHNRQRTQAEPAR